MKPRFLDELARILKSEKPVTFVSDDPDYVQETCGLFQAHPRFHACAHPTNFSNYGTSWFEELWREKGKEIHYLQYCVS